MGEGPRGPAPALARSLPHEHLRLWCGTFSREGPCASPNPTVPAPPGAAHGGLR